MASRTGASSALREMKAFSSSAPRRHKRYKKVGASDSQTQADDGEEDDDLELVTVTSDDAEHREDSGGDASSAIVELQSPDSSAAATTSQPASDHPPADESDECLQVDSMFGLQYSVRREALYYLLAVCTAFLSALLAFWLPARAAVRRYRVCALSTAHFVLVLTRNGQAEFCAVERITAAPQSQRPLTFVRYHRPPPPLDPSEKMIVFRHRRYIYDERAQSFLRLAAPAALPYAAVAASMSHGTSSDAAAASLALHGANAIDIPVPSIPTLLVREVLHPFFVFQIYSIVLWSFEQYFYFAACILVIAAVSIVTTLMETRSRLKALSDLAHFTSTVTVLRDGRWVELPSSALTAGDVVQVETGVLPCDLALLSGACVVNESTLTGESLPILKSPLDLTLKADDALVPLTSSSHTLFSATTVLQVKPDPSGDGRVVGLVVRTGWATTKGSLILSIMYPAPSSFRFVEQSYRFIAALFGLAMVGFAISLWQLHRVGASASTMALRSMDLITIVVQPSLPLALSVGTNYALLALRRQKVHCISPAKINVAGKVRIVAFDKTGTLTSDGMEMKGVRPVGTDGQFGAFLSAIVDSGAGAERSVGDSSGDELELSADRHPLGMDGETDDADVQAAGSPSSPSTGQDVNVDPVLHAALSCCHSLAVLDGALIGDPLEAQIFRFTGASIEESDASSDKGAAGARASSSSSTSVRVPTSASSSSLVRLVHVYEFQSALQRMTVVCRDDAQRHWVFTKGAPEVVQALCAPSTVPASFTATFAAYARQGYRVLAIACKQTDGAQLSASDREQLRPSLERGLRMLALIVLENAVKPETAPTLRVLRTAKVRCIMVTGDYPVTAVTVAKECGLVPEGVRVYQAALREGELQWTDNEDDSLHLDPLTLRPVDAAPHAFELMVTGDVFRHLSSSSTPPSAFRRVLLSTLVFARMSPDQKSLLLTSLQSLSLYCGMVGDGANDAAALRAAHAGISLSLSEASIAAPFTYLEPNIRCVPLLLCQGRSALQTSFSLFKFIAMYRTQRTHAGRSPRGMLV